MNETAKAWYPSSLDAERSDRDEAHAKTIGSPGKWGSEYPGVLPIQADLFCLIKYNISIHGVTGSCEVLEPKAAGMRSKCAKVVLARANALLSFFV